MLFDSLEPRQLFASVTLIAHGYMPSGKAPAWQSQMANAIAKQEGGADIYRLTIRGEGDDAHVSSFKPVKVGATPTGDVVVILDWADSSDVLGTRTDASDIAELAAPYFVNPIPDTAGNGRTQPLGELPIHLIGHSRGASVVTELAKDLGQRGMWVDQVTTLDPREVLDPEVVAWSNITFFDNYYQTKAVNIPSAIVSGHSVDGAKNVHLDDVFPIDLFSGNHENVWAYYGGTIDTSLTKFGDGRKIDPEWYSEDDTGPRNRIGYYYTRDVGGSRPDSGNRFQSDGGSAHRESLTVYAEGANRWDNVSFLKAFAPKAVDEGDNLTFDLRVQDVNNDATFTVYLDSDDNPYNGGLIPTGATYTTSSDSGETWSPVISTAGLASGNYYLVAVAENGTRTRYEYSTGALTVLPAGTGANGTVISFSSAKKVTYLDGAGNRITPKLTGPGTGLIVIPADGQSPSLISLTGTTAVTSFSLTGKATTATTLSVSGSLKSLTASNLTLSAGLSITGSVGNLNLSGVSGSVQLSGSVNAFSVKSVSNASILAGFSATATAETLSKADITTPGVTIKSFAAKSFSGSLLAASNLTTVKLTALAGDSTVGATSLGTLTSPVLKLKKPLESSSAEGLSFKLLV